MSSSREDPDTSRERPRPSWGQPGPDSSDTSIVPPEQSEPSVVPPSSPEPYGYGYGQPGQPAYGSVPPPAAPPQSWPSQQQPPPGQQQGWPPPQSWGPPTPSQYGRDLGQHEQAYAQMYGEKPRTGMAIASMVLGILAFISCWIPVLSYASVVMAVLALIFGFIAVRRRGGRGMAIAGLILGGLGLVASVLFSIFYTGLFIDAARIAEDCSNEDPSLGRVYERCVTERSNDIIPFQ